MCFITRLFFFFFLLSILFFYCPSYARASSGGGLWCEAGGAEVKETEIIVHFHPSSPLPVPSRDCNL